LLMLVNLLLFWIGIKQKLCGLFGVIMVTF